MKTIFIMYLLKKMPFFYFLVIIPILTFETQTKKEFNESALSTSARFIRRQV